MDLVYDMIVRELDFDGLDWNEKSFTPSKSHPRVTCPSESFFLVCVVWALLVKNLV